MEATIGNHTFNYPSSPDELLLGDWIEFIRAYAYLDTRAAEIEEIKNPLTHYFQTLRLQIERAYAVTAFFAGVDMDEAKAIFPAHAVAQLYKEHHSQCFNVPEYDGTLIYQWGDITYTLQEPLLQQSGSMTFGEILDSKQMLQNSVQSGWSKWELIQKLSAIFLRTEAEQYDESFAWLGAPRPEMMLQLPIRGALLVSSWYERLNDFLEAHFTLFQAAAIKSGSHMRKHFSSWGWVNLLSSVAASKVFDVQGSGKNSIECVKAAKAFDVLLYASEQKSYSEALAADQKQQQ